MNLEVCCTGQESKRGTSNLKWDDMFDYDVCNRFFFALSKEDLPNKSTSEKMESFKFKILLSMFPILFIRINVSSQKRGQ